ncbi:class I SAM-dependent methyltransferase [Candidatus Poribacteria bacterium]|nr:class I SAM-dependent methyltransferase [Candidatus Poribacteria bacterium]
MSAAFVRFKRWVKKHRWLYAVASCPYAAPVWDRRVARLIREAGPLARVADVGAGERKRAPHVWNLEIVPMPGTDVVGDCHRLPFADSSLELVIIEAVLEHVRDPAAVVDEIRRALLPGGIVCAAVPFLQGFHASPADYQRWTLAGFEALFAAFDVGESGVCVGPTASLHWVLREWVGLVVSFGNLWIAKVVAWLVGWATAPLLLLDLWLARRRDSHQIASAVYVIAQRPPTT